MVADILRAARDDLTNRDIASMVIAGRQWDTDDQDLLDRVSESVKPVTRRLRKRAAI